MKWWESDEYAKRAPMHFPEPGTRRTRSVADPTWHPSVSTATGRWVKRPRLRIHLGPSFR